MTITFVDSIKPCEIDGHKMVLHKDWSEPKQFLYEKIEICKVCKIKIKHSRYKWMPENTEIIK